MDRCIGHRDLTLNNVGNKNKDHTKFNAKIRDHIHHSEENSLFFLHGLRAQYLSRKREGLENRKSLVWSPRIGDSLCDRIHPSFPVVHCFDKGRLGKQPVAKKEYCAEYWLNHYHTMPHFEAIKIYSCGKHCEKRKNCL